MQPIDPSKLITAETQKGESNKSPDDIKVSANTNTSNAVSPSVISKDINSADINHLVSSAIAEKQRLAIGLLLKQTLQKLSSEGLLSINTQKAILNAKNILPGEFTQLYIQERVQQHKTADSLASQPIKPSPLSIATVNQWQSGQLLQGIVYQAPQNGNASLLVHPSGQFNPALLAQIPLAEPNSPVQTIEKLISNEIIKSSQEVQIKTSLDLQAGQQLLIQVNKSTSGVSFALNHPPTESNFISQYINQLATQQQALPQLITTLKEVATQTNQANSFFTPAFKAQVESILQQFPQLSELAESKKLTSAIQNSGLYLESKIVNTVSSPINNINQPALLSGLSQELAQNDLKAALNRLVALINSNEAIILPKMLQSTQSSLYNHVAIDSLLAKPSVQSSLFFDLPAHVHHAQVQKTIAEASLFQLNNPLLMQGRILDQVESVLSRIIITQFQNRESGDQSFLNIEIPFKHNDQQEILQLKIREELKEKEAELGNKIWTVNMAFNLESLGGIRIYITLDKKDIAMQFWTEEKESQQLFQKYFSLLNSRLTMAGYTISQLAAFHGMPEEAEKEQNKSNFIIDERV
ncbi:MAG: flagellar hook-length control protein FliK [Gammaproteobacteria bacterium]|nr:flagellar hook-length control protein FliK [Gammaproteobacteria bacterium]